MNAKELKEILANVPDDTMVLVSNPQWKTTEILHHQYCPPEGNWKEKGKGVLYLDIKNFKR